MQYNDSIFHWCAKCNKGAGQWVTSHQTSTHVNMMADHTPSQYIPAYGLTYSWNMQYSIALYFVPLSYFSAPVTTISVLHYINYYLILLLNLNLTTIF
jgi:hypothetical protein